MEGRGLVVVGVVAVLALAGIGAVMFSGGSTGGPVADRVDAPGGPAAVGAAGSDGYSPPSVPTGDAAPPGAEPTAVAAEPRLTLPDDATPEDGGLAFGVSVCDKLEACACEGRNQQVCAHDWRWVKAEDWGTVRCVLDLSCADVCRHSQHPKDVACLAAVDDVHAERIGSRPWENPGPDVPGIVSGKQ